MSKINRTREDLIRLCEINSSIAGDFATLDSLSFHKNHGICWALLKAECDYFIRNEEEDFVIVSISYPSFKKSNTAKRITGKPLTFVLATFKNNPEAHQQNYETEI